MKNKKLQKMALLAILTAIIILMSFTPLGYLKTAGLEITFIMVPVAIGAILCGPKEGAFLGGIFGLTSFIQCFGLSPFGATLLSINPFYTFVVCVLSRILAGYLSGLSFKLITKKKSFKPAFFISSLVASFMNTLLFMSSLILCFWNTEFIQNLSNTLGATNILSFVVLFVGLQGLVEAIVCTILSSVISFASATALKKYSI